MGQTIRVTKGLAYDSTSSVTINVRNEFFDVQQKAKTSVICRLTTLIQKDFSKPLNAAR